MSFDILEKVIDITNKYNCEADVILSEGESLSLSSFQTKIDKLKVSGSKIVGVRVIKDQRSGISYSEALDEASLELMVKNAVDNSHYSDVNEFETISKGEASRDIKDFSRSDSTSMQEKIKLAIDLEKEVFAKDPKVAAVPYTGFGEQRGSKSFLNSKGTSFKEITSYFSCYTSALIKEGGESSSHHHSAYALNFSELNWKNCVEESYKHAKEWMSAEKVKSGKYDIIFEVSALASLFDCFQGIFSGKRASDNNNPFLEKLGTKIASDKLTIIDSPRYKDSFFPSFFDDEGQMQEDLFLVENGKFLELLHNSSTAQKLGMKNNFRAARGAKSGLGVSSSTMIIKENSLNDTSLFDGQYLELHSLQGLHSGANFYSGEFSFAASGYLCEKGERIMPVKGITVAGNFYKMLDSIKTIGNKLDSTTNKGFFAPDIRFEGLYVAGL